MRKALAVLLIAFGCGGSAGSGSATVKDGIPGTTLGLHTVYGWVTTVDTMMPDPMTGKWNPAAPESLTIDAVGATFDATHDLRFLTAAQQLQANLDLQLGGAIRLTFGDVAQIIPNMPYTFMGAGDGCSITWGESAVADTAAATEPVVLGSAVTCSITFSKVDSSVGGEFAGTLTYTVKATSSDPASAVSGTLTVDLSGPLVNEILGACNDSVLGGFGAGSCPSPQMAGSGF